MAKELEDILSMTADAPTNYLLIKSVLNVLLTLTELKMMLLIKPTKRSLTRTPAK